MEPEWAQERKVQGLESVMAEVVGWVSGVSEKGKDLQRLVGLVGQVWQKKKYQHLPTAVEVWRMTGWNRVDLVKGLRRLELEATVSTQMPTLTLAQEVSRSLLGVE